MKVKCFLLFSFVIHIIPLYSQSRDSAYSQRIVELEKQVAVLEERINSMSNDNEQFYDRMRIWKEAAPYMVFEKYLGIILLILGILGVPSILGLSALAKKIAESIFNRRIEHLFRIKSDLLETILSDAEATGKSKRQRITVISKESDNLDFLRSFFATFGFQRVHYKDFGEVINRRAKFLIINNENDALTCSEIKRFIEKHDKIPALIFQRERVDGLKQEEITFANSRNTLYSRMIESLLYGKVIKSL